MELASITLTQNSEDVWPKLASYMLINHISKTWSFYFCTCTQLISQP